MIENLVYDVGMHNGDDTAYYLSLGYRVVAIEASPALVEEAQHRFRDSIAAQKLTILNFGIASDEGIFDFYLNQKSSVWNSFDKKIGTREGSAVETIKVRTKSIDQVILEYGTPHYLKVDIEGHDILCLSRLSGCAEKPPYISAEVNGIELIETLHELGYTEFKLIDQFSFLPLELPAFTEYALFLRHKKFRESRSTSARIIRRLFGKYIDKHFDKKISPLFSYPHPFGSSGPFGEYLPGSWMRFEEVIRTYVHYKSQHELSPRNNGYNFWVDIHARR